MTNSIQQIMERIKNIRKITKIYLTNNEQVFTRQTGKEILKDLDCIETNVNNLTLQTMYEIGAAQDEYQKQKTKRRMTKQDICNIAIPIRDKYHLTDIETLQIIRSELSLSEIAKLLDSKTMQNE